MEAIIWLLNTTGQTSFKMQKEIGKIYSLILKDNQVWHSFDYRYLWKKKKKKRTDHDSIFHNKCNIEKSQFCLQGTSSFFSNLTKPSAVSTENYLIYKGKIEVREAQPFYGFNFLPDLDDSRISISRPYLAPELQFCIYNYYQISLLMFPNHFIFNIIKLNSLSFTKPTLSSLLHAQ